MRPQRAGAEPKGLEHDGGVAADLLRERVQEVVDLDGAPRRLLLGASQERLHGLREVGLAALGLLQSRERRFGFRGDVRRVGAGLAKHLGHASIAIDGPRQQVNRLDEGVFSLVGRVLRGDHQSPCVGGEAFEMERRHGG